MFARGTLCSCTAAGGVGGFAIQLAKAAKAFVIGTCSPANKRYVVELGADEVIDYRTEDVFQRAKAIAGPQGIDAVVDCIGASNGGGPRGGLACIAGIPDLSVVPDLPIPSRFTTSVWEAFWARRLFAGDKKIWVEW